MAEQLRFQDRLQVALTERLAAKGFERVNRERIMVETSSLKPGQPLVYPNEEHFVLNLNNGRPIFAVFVKKDEKANTITVLASNPREDVAGSSMDVRGQYFKRTLKQTDGTPEEVAERVVAYIETLAAHKTSLRAQIHFHSRFLLDGAIAHDDGYSNFISIVRRALLHHVDFLIYTPHNAFEYALYERLKPILYELGITLALASEITMPILKNHPNGPHHLVIAANKEAAEEVSRGILAQCNPDLKMVSYFLGMTIDKMYDVLAPLRAQGLIITGVAHPVNFSEKILPIRGIGLFSAVDAGHISYDEAVRFALQNNFIEGWNDSIYERGMAFRTDEFEQRVRALANKFKLPGKLSPNLCNLALAMEFAESGLGQSFGTDTHVMPSLDRTYLIGGDPFSRGWTVLETQQEKLPKDRRLSAEELVAGIAKGDIKMGAVLFTQVVDDILQLVQRRKEMPEDMQREVRKQRDRQYAEYVHVLIKDAFGFLLGGELDELGNMSK